MTVGRVCRPTVVVDLHTVARVVGLLSLLVSVGLVLAGFTWCVVGVAISGYTLGLLSGVHWFLEPWMESMERRTGR